MDRALRVLITRPIQQAQSLALQLKSEGYQASMLPLLQIQPVELGTSIHAANTLIFVSANAVRMGLSQLESRGVELSGKRLLAIGPATRAEIEKAGFTAEISESGYRSEELLDKLRSEKEVTTEYTLVCGVGGREFLEKGLGELGALVNRLEVYRRVPSEDIESSLADLNQQTPPDLISLMNEESLWIFEMAISGLGLDHWKKIPVLVSSTRIQESAKQLGFIQVFCQPDPTERALIEFLAQFSH
jgi:uroporphyrinogen-III synthase